MPTLCDCVEDKGGNVCGILALWPDTQCSVSNHQIEV